MVALPHLLVMVLGLIDIEGRLYLATPFPPRNVLLIQSLTA